MVRSVTVRNHPTHIPQRATVLAHRSQVQQYLRSIAYNHVVDIVVAAALGAAARRG